MPRLLLFAPCQKAIIDRDETLISMIAILHGIGISAPTGEEVPANASTQVNWATVSIWLRTPGDEDRTFEQRLEVVSPDGVVQGHVDTSFTMTMRNHQNLTGGNTFPVGLPGEYTLRLLLREVGAENAWQMISEYPFVVTHNRVERPNE